MHFQVNNAGVGLTGPFTETPIEAYDKVFNVNVRSVMALTQLAIPHLIKSKGNIVNISSGLGMKPNQFAFVYSCSKATLDHFTKCLALELGPEGVRVNAVKYEMMDYVAYLRLEVSLKFETFLALDTSLEQKS